MKNLALLLLVTMVATSMVFGFAIPANAQASLASSDMMELSVKLKDDDNKTKNINFTVVRDAKDKYQWYYIPAVIRIVEDNNGEPKFTILKYQVPDPKNPEKLVEGGILQFSATLSLDPKAVTELRKEIADAIDVKSYKQIRLAAIPMKDVKISVFDFDDTFVTAGEPTPGVGPTVSTAEIPFTVKLTKLGAQAFEQLARGSTGYKVVIDYKYTGLTPRVGCKVTFDWSKVQKHVSSQLKEKTTTNRPRWWHPWCFWRTRGYSRDERQKDVTKVWDQLKTDSSVVVDKILNADFKDEDANKLIDPILKRIETKLIALDKVEFDKVEPAKAKDVNQPNTWWGSTSTNNNYTEKEVTKEMLVKETFTYNVQYMQDVPSQAGGFIGLGDYEKEIQDKHIIVMAEGYQSAYFSLPPVSDGELADIMQVTITVAVMEEGKANKSMAKTAIWKSVSYDDKIEASGWFDPKTKKPINNLVFPLMELYDRNKGKTDKLKYWVESTVQRPRGDVIKKSEEIPMFDGAVPVTTPFASFNFVTIYSEFLTFEKLDEDELSTLQAATVMLKSGKRTLSKSISPKKKGKNYKLLNDTIVWLTDRDDTVTASIEFSYKDPANEKKTRKSTWEKNGVDLRTIGTELYLEDAVNEEGDLLWFKDYDDEE